MSNFNYEITSGEKTEAIQLSIYGTEGFGKSNWAAKAPYSLTLDNENGTGRIANCRRINITSWTMAIDVIQAVIDNPTVCKTLVIDTMDRLETYAIDYLCEKNHKASIEDWAYGRGYTALMELFQGFYKTLDKVHDLGIHIILVAHAKPRKFELPDQEGSFDRFELKLNKQTAPLLKEWVDALLFGNYKTYVVTTENKTHKPQGNKRVLFCNHQPTFDAKNRFGLPDEIPFDFESVAHLFGEPAKEPETVVETIKANESAVHGKLRTLMSESNVTDDQLEKVVTDRGHYKADQHIADYTDEFITRWVFPNWKKICETITNSHNNGGNN